MTSQRPAWLADALKRGASAGSGRKVDTDVADLMPGDLWVVAPDRRRGPRRIVLVLDCETDTSRLHVALVSNDVDVATAADIVLDRADTGADFPLVVETQLLARVWWRQARQRIGAIDDDLLDQILDFIWDERPDGLAHRRGLGVRPEDASARESYEKDELEDLKALAATSDDRYGTVPAIPVLVEAELSEAALNAEEVLAVAKSMACGHLYFYHRHDLEEASGKGRRGMASRVGLHLAADMFERVLLECAQSSLLSGFSIVEVRSLDDDPLSSIVCDESLPTDVPVIRVISGLQQKAGPIGYLGGAQVFATSGEDGE